MEIQTIHVQPPAAVTPHSIEAEQQLLGAIFMDQRHIATVEVAGGERLFFEPLHARIYEIARDKDRAGHLVSPVTIRAAMDGDLALAHVGGPAYLARLAGASAASFAAGDYAAILRDKRAKRDLIDAMDAAREAMDDTPIEVIAGRLEAALIDTSAADSPKGPVSMAKAVTVAMEQIHAAYTGTEDFSLRSGIPSLDAMLGGFYPGEMILIGGRPSMGKTAVALTIALNAARSGAGVAVASLEMNPEAMAIRALSEHTAQGGHGIPYSVLRRGTFREGEVPYLTSAAKDAAELPLVFLPRHYADIGALFAGARQAQRAMQGNLRLLIVDYAQLLRSQARNRFEQITEISIALKALAGQLNVPVIALSQLSRAVEQREDKRPTLSDLRESGQLEQDADAVIFCYRDSYYLEREKPQDDNLEAMADWMIAMDRARNRLDLIVAKQRQGEIGTASVMMNAATNLIWEDPAP
jgi:replicative DNA helicase